MFMRSGRRLPPVASRHFALFSFPGLAACEICRTQSQSDPACQAAFQYANDTRCIVSYERSFMRPVFG